MSLNVDIAAGLGGSGDPGGALGSTGAVYSHTIGQSVRCDGSTSFLHFTPSNAATDSSKMTFSTWVKTWGFGISDGYILSAGASNIDGVGYPSTNKFAFVRAGVTRVTGNAIRRDPAAWYHLYVTYDGDGDGYVRIYVNGVLDNQDAETTDLAKLGVNGQLHRLVRKSNASTYLDLYLAETHFIDGSIVPISTFGETSDGVWVPKETTGITYGNNGWYLDYADSSDIGKDVSGRGNHWTSSGLGAHDVVPDSPTNNYCIMTPLPSNYISQISFAEGGLKCQNSTVHKTQFGTFPITSGKWYWEAVSAGGNKFTIGLTDVNNVSGYKQDGGTNYIVGYTPSSSYGYGDAVGIYAGTLRKNGSTVASSLGYSVGDKMGIAFDADAGKVWFHKNGTWYNGSGTDSTTLDSSNHDTTVTTGEAYVPAFSIETPTTWVVNFGQDGTFATGTGGGYADENGHGDFFYSVPSGFLALNSENLSDVTIGPGQDTQAVDHFETILYTGSGDEQHIGSGGAQHPQDTITIANSLKFNHGDSSFLSYQPGANGDTQIMTYSGWIKRGDTSKYQLMFQAVDSQYDSIWIEPTNHKLQVILGSTSTAVVTSTRAIRDTSKWYHICVNVDTTQSTASDRIKVWIDGVQDTLTGTQPNQNDPFAAWFKNGITHRINYEGGSTYGSGYYAEVHVTEGTAYDYTYFGQVGTNGYWIPKTVSGITYGDEGFYLDFADSSAIGDDESGNSPPNDFSTTQVVAEDVTIDSPTQNFCTLNPDQYSGIGTFSNGNLTIATTTNSRSTYGTIAVPSSGKWYYEVRVDSNVSGGGIYFGWGTKVDEGDTEYTGDHGITFSNYNEQVLLDGTGQSGGYGSTGTNVSSNGDVYSVLLDVDNGLFYYAKNGTYFNSANPSNGTGGLGVSGVIGQATTEIRPVFSRGGSYNETYSANFGQDPSFNGNETAPGTDKTDANGRGKFLYDVPTGFLALMDDNIPQEGIAAPDWVWIKQRASSSLTHQLVDTVRGKKSGAASFARLRTDSTAVEATPGNQGVLDITNAGFTVGNDTSYNQEAKNYVAWTWKAGGPKPTQTYTVTVASDGGQNKYRFDGNSTYAPTLSLQEGGTYTFDWSAATTHPFSFSTTSDGTHNSGTEYTVGVVKDTSAYTTTITVAHGAPTLYYYCSSHSGMGGQVNTTTTHGSTNLKGSIQSIVSANQDAGFSIVSWTGNQTNGDTVGHGLLQTPEFIIVKNRDVARNWLAWHPDLTNEYVLYPHLTNVQNNSPASFGTHTSDVFGVDASVESNESTKAMIAYCFHSVEGYQKIGSFTGTKLNYDDGVFVYCGFRPAFLITKVAGTNGSWVIHDNKRAGPYNGGMARQYMDSVSAETAYNSNRSVEFYSNGFSIHGNDASSNTNRINQAKVNIFYAVAEQPFKFANAR